MKTKMTVCLLFCLLTVSTAWAKKDVEDLRYDISCAGSGVQGTYLVKVYVYHKKGKVSDDALKQAAIHGVLFQGFTGTNGCTSQKAMAGATVEQEKADYFKAFFASGGAYLKFASVSPASYERIKTADKGYKVGAIIQVRKDELRKELEGAGVIRSLSSGF